MLKTEGRGAERKQEEEGEESILRAFNRLGVSRAPRQLSSQRRSCPGNHQAGDERARCCQPCATARDSLLQRRRPVYFFRCQPVLLGGKSGTPGTPHGTAPPGPAAAASPPGAAQNVTHGEQDGDTRQPSQDSWQHPLHLKCFGRSTAGGFPHAHRSNGLTHSSWSSPGPKSAEFHLMSLLGTSWKSTL